MIVIITFLGNKFPLGIPSFYQKVMSPARGLGVERTVPWGVCMGGHLMGSLGQPTLQHGPGEALASSESEKLARRD